MNESCHNCGAELYEGQQFCRRCGTPVGAAVRGGEAPTQLFDGGVKAGVAAPFEGTVPLGGGARTDGVAAQRPTEYHPGPGQQTSALVGQPFGSQPLAVGAPPPPKRRRGVWLFALLGVFVLGLMVASAAAFFFLRAARTGTVVRVVKTAPPPPVPEVPPVPEMPEIPADLGARVKEALESLKMHGIPMPLDESGAVVSGSDTVVTRTFNLDSDASFKAHVVSGSVTVVGAEDADETVVKVIKRGGSAEQRAATRVLAAESEEGIVLVSGAAAGGPVNVSYEITVPRQGLRRLELSAQKGDLKVSEFDGDVDLSVTNGSVTVGTSGAVRSRVVNGRTSVTYAGPHEEPQEFSVVNGDLEVSLPGEQEVELKAASTNGRIEVDGALPLKAEKRGAGHRVEGELGGGGAALNVKVVNGNIRLKK